MQLFYRKTINLYSFALLFLSNTLFINIYNKKERELIL